MTTTAMLATQNPWLHLFDRAGAPPASERLVRALEAHQAAEDADIVSCRQLAQRLGDPVAELLIGMLVEDGQRHKSLLGSMISRLHEEVEFVASPGAVPVPDGSELAHPVYGSVAETVSVALMLHSNE